VRATAATSAADDEKDLRRFFLLAPEDLTLLDTVRGDAHRLAFALLLVWMRAERVPLTDPTVLPAPVIAFVSAQLGLLPEILTGYHGWPTTQAADTAAIREHLVLRTFTPEDATRLRSFLIGKVAHTGNTAALLDAAQDWLVREGLLRPAGETTIERLIYAARTAAEEDLFATMAQQLTDAQRQALDGLCTTEGADSVLARLGVPPRAPSAVAIADECARLELIRAALPPALDWRAITTNRRRQWAAVVRRLSAQAMRRYPPAKRATLLLAFLTVRGEEVTDAIVEMVDVLIGRIFAQSTVELSEAKLEHAQAHAEGARLFRTIAQVLLDPAIPPEDVRPEVFRRIPREQVSAVVAHTLALDTTEAEAFFAALDPHFRYLRAFAPLVLSTLRFGSPRADNDLLDALEVLATMNAEHRVQVPPTAPVAFIPRRWEQAVVRDTGVDRHGWEFCLLYQARAALRAGDLTVTGSRRYTPWDTDLYTAPAWQDRRSTWRAESRLPEDGSRYVEQAIRDLDEVTTQVARRLPRNTGARIERGKLTLTALEKIDVPPTVEVAREALVAVLRSADAGLPDLLMEVDHWTGFASALTHLTGRRPPTAEHLAAVRPALFAVLIAEATNMGLATMARAAGIPEGQLTRVYDWYFREETLRQAITTLIQYHQTLPLTQAFGSGTTSSSDGVRFGVAASTLNARHNPRVFALRRGVTVYNHVSDQGPQFWIDVVNVALREATFVLDGLVYQDTYTITEHYTDTHGATDLVFGLFTLLGFGFAPRLRDLPDQVLYRAKKGGDYGALTPVLRQSLRTDLIVRHWDDLNRLAASLHDGMARPSLVVAKLQALQRQNPLQQALQELGRLAKTQHILRYVDDETLRRRVLIGLNKGERLHALARVLFFGRQGRFGDRGYEAQLTRASALSLVINALVVWNTRYLQQAAETLALRGRPVPDEVWSHLTPHLWEHVHLIGHYRFEEPVITGDLRPLRAERT